MHVRNTVLILLVCLLGWSNTASADLVGWWRFDEESGDVAADSSGHGLDAAIEGAVWTEGHSGSALTFNGVDSVVRMPSRTVGLVQTVTAWVKVDAVESGQRQIFNGNGPPHMNFELQDGQIQGRMYTGSTNVTLTGPVVPVGVWTHVAWVYDVVMNRSELFIDGESVALGDAVNSIAHTSAGPTIGSHPTQVDRSFLGAIDDVRIYDHGLTLGEIKADMKGAAFSHSPNPREAAVDVLRDAMLTWESGEFAQSHDVYIGTAFEDVTDATVPTSAGLSDASFDPGRLEFGQTYYWRVDEVNGAPDNTVFKGDVWSFTVEPYAIMIPVDVDHVTASSSTDANPPSLAVDGSGLDGTTHTTDSDTMWLSATPELDPWIMFEFDSVQKLDHMLIWNSNAPSEGFIGWGIKDVKIEISVDGVDWTNLADSTEVSRAPGQPTYNAPQAIDLDLALAKYVRLNILSNWGGLLKQYGVAEVQFYGLPVQARTPDPASGAAGVLPNSVVTWRAGREADKHTVYVGLDADALTSSVSSNTSSADLTSLDLQLDQTYVWRVDEVNDTEVPSIWGGDIWSFSTVPYVTVDDFESYGNLSPNRPFQTWLDGFGYSADEFFPVEYPGNGTGSGVGHDIWSPGSPQFDGQIMESTIAKSGQSMPLYFNNTGGISVSEAVKTFESAQDWT
ncbi:MAG: discoidin domain-containing protein, partial [Phycisphaerae bacterium]|nr:discoidin domain-containing protein [Phycisphaerae bacterium]